jgi:hypothetical protein
VIGIENAVDNEVCKCEEEARHPSWVRNKFFATEKVVKNETSIRKCGQRCTVI